MPPAPTGTLCTRAPVSALNTCTAPSFAPTATALPSPTITGPPKIQKAGLCLYESPGGAMSVRQRVETRSGAAALSVAAVEHAAGRSARKTTHDAVCAANSIGGVPSPPARRATRAGPQMPSVAWTVHVAAPLPASSTIAFMSRPPTTTVVGVGPSTGSNTHVPFAGVSDFHRHATAPSASRTATTSDSSVVTTATPLPATTSGEPRRGLLIARDHTCLPVSARSIATVPSMHAATKHFVGAGALASPSAAGHGTRAGAAKCDSLNGGRGFPHTRAVHPASAPVVARMLRQRMMTRARPRTWIVAISTSWRSGGPTRQ
mmetsp:Transcript_7586/g.23670  ORF Transcript_7586/g.23670 Transcript_7586/m.23670 type:complete len:318 (-) Transcript_7586:20-973(-)